MNPQQSPDPRWVTAAPQKGSAARKWKRRVVGAIAYAVAVVAMFYLGFYGGALFSPPPDGPPVGVSLEAKTASPPSAARVPPAVSGADNESAPPPANRRRPPKPPPAARDSAPEAIGEKPSKPAEVQEGPAGDQALPKQSMAVPPIDQRILTQLNSDFPDAIRAAAKQLYQGRYENPQLLDRAAEVLEAQYRRPSQSWMHVDASAWICKALARSGNRRYLQVLDQVARNAPSRKLSSYARRALRDLR